MAEKQAKPNAELQLQYNNFKSTLQGLASRIGDLETESDEYKLVISTLEPLDAGRKCFRSIGGVLVERTVADVLPTLQTNLEGIRNLMDQLLERYKSQEKQFQAWQKDNNVQIVRQP